VRSKYQQVGGGGSWIKVNTASFELGNLVAPAILPPAPRVKQALWTLPTRLLAPDSLLLLLMQHQLLHAQVPDPAHVELTFTRQ
jgi:hypothetical protein